MMFAQCTKGAHSDCRVVLPGGRAVACNCPCHSGGRVPQHPCPRCHGTGYYGPWSVNGGRCFQCDGTGESNDAMLAARGGAS